MARGKRVYLTVENMSVLKEALDYARISISNGVDSYEGKQKSLLKIQKVKAKL